MSENRQSELRRCLVHFGEAEKRKRTSGSDELLNDIHRAIVLLVYKDEEIRLDEAEALGQAFEEIASSYEAPISDLGRFGLAFTVLRAGHFERAVEGFQRLIGGAEGCPAALQLSALCFAVVAETLAQEMDEARNHLDQASSLVDAMLGKATLARGLVAMAETLHWSRTGEQERALQCWEDQRRAFWSAGYDMHSRLPYFEAQGLLSYAQTLRELGRYQEALETLKRERALRDVMGDRLGEVWGRLEEARVYRFRREYDEAELALDLAATFLKNCDLHDLKARVADKQGDIFRARGQLSEARRAYTRAEQLALASGQSVLQAHVANSVVRLLLDEQKPDEAYEILVQHETTWRNTKDHGKYLYLRGQTEAFRSNLRLAEELYLEALEELRRFGMPSYEALTLNRLAQLYLQRDGDKKQACEKWSEALKIAGNLQSERLFQYVKEAVDELAGADLVPIVEEVMRDRAKSRQEAEDLRKARLRLEERRFREVYAIGHWIVEPIWEFLRETDPENEALAPVFHQFMRLMRGTVEWSRWMTGQEAPAEMNAAEVKAAIAESALKASEELDLPVPVEVVIDEGLRGAFVDPGALRELLRALFRGLASAFGVKRIRVTPKAKEDEGGWRLIPEGLSRGDLDCARQLVAINLALKDEQLRSLFSRGYTGDFTLADFLAGIVVGAELRWEEDTDPPSVVIDGLTTGATKE